MKPKLSLAMLLFMSAGMASLAAQPAEAFEKRELVYRGDTLPYRILYPEHYDRSKKYPSCCSCTGRANAERTTKAS